MLFCFYYAINKDFSALKKESPTSTRMSQGMKTKFQRPLEYNIYILHTLVHYHSIDIGIKFVKLD